MYCRYSAEWKSGALEVCAVRCGSAPSGCAVISAVLQVGQEGAVVHRCVQLWCCGPLGNSCSIFSAEIKPPRSMAFSPLLFLKNRKFS